MSEVFVGRQGELAAIDEAAALARAGHPIVVVIEGDAGSGKTALARRALARLGANATVVSAVADDLAADRPLGMLRAWVDPALADSPLDAGLALLDRLGELNLGALLALFLEDLHWADPVSRAAMLSAARRLDSERLLVVITTRPEAQSPDPGWERLLSDTERARRIRVGALTVDDVSELASHHGSALPPSSARRLHGHTGGNALYVTTLLRECSAAQLNSAGDELPVPRSLAATVIERVEELPDDARELLAALAVLNAPTPLPRLAAVTRVDAPADSLDALVGTGYVTWRPQELIGPVSFSHPLYRAAVYTGLPAPRRRELHLAAATVTDHATSLAHRVAAADRLDDELADELEAAAQPAATQQHAARLLRWSSELTSDRPTGERRLLRAASILLETGDVSALWALRPSLEACTPGPHLSIITGQLAWHDGDAATAERHLLAAAQATEPDVRCMALVLLAHQYNVHTRYQQAADAASRASEVRDARPNLRRAASSPLAMGLAMLEGPEAGLGVLAQWLPPAPEDVAPDDAELLAVRGLLHQLRRPRAAIADLVEVTHRLRRDVNHEWLPRAHVYLAHSFSMTGEWDDALVHAHIALELVVDDDHPWQRAQAHLAAGYVLAGRGLWEQAQEHVEGAATAADSAGTLENSLAFRLAVLAVHRARHEPEALLATLQPLLDDRRHLPMLMPLHWWVPYISALIESRQLDAADRELAEFDAARVRRIADTARTTALRAQLTAARGDVQTALGQYADSIAAINADDPLLDVAAIHFDHGRLLRRVGQHQAALDQLRLARSLLEPVGAEPYLARIDAELSDMGLPRSRRHHGSPLDLTPRERAVALLAGRGSTNKEIAAELYVSAKAVDYHLGKIYGKLGINSRRQLRALSTMEREGSGE